MRGENNDDDDDSGYDDDDNDKMEIWYTFIGTERLTVCVAQ